jgi:hypothetical protein
MHYVPFPASLIYMNVVEMCLNRGRRSKVAKSTVKEFRPILSRAIVFGAESSAILSIEHCGMKTHAASGETSWWGNPR